MTPINEQTLYQRASHIKLMIFDVDGILTDGSLHIGPQGEIVKIFHVHDGHGIKSLQQVGIITAIISARQSLCVTQRARELNITHVYQGVADKRIAFQELLTLTKLQAADCAYAGDDLVDLPILSQVGLAISVPNAHADVKSRVHHVTAQTGGQGAAREICDLLLRAQNHYDAILASYYDAPPK